MRHYYCMDCRERFTVRTGTVMECSRLPVQKWVIAIYLVMINLKGRSSRSLARDLRISQKAAWFMLHRIREAIAPGPTTFEGTVEADEAYVGGIKRFMTNSRKRRLKAEGKTWHTAKTMVVGVFDRETRRVRANVSLNEKADNVGGVVKRYTTRATQLHTDKSNVYNELLNPRESVDHHRHEWVRGDVHTNGIESFWTMFKRGYRGVYHYMSPKHLDRYVQEFAGRKDHRGKDTLQQLVDVAAAMVGKRLTWTRLTDGPCER